MPSSLLHQRILDWYSREARVLPWREPGTSHWGILVSEVMLQQTPVARVEPVWRQWMSAWPSPAALAASAPGDAVHAWGRLGYPRRAVRLHSAASAMVERHGGEVPRTHEELLALPGVGAYTAAAVAVFAFGLRETVVDTNVRRVLARVVTGSAQAAPSLTRAEVDLATSVLPSDAHTARRWNVGVMELGALVCSARMPRCPDCPVQDLCAWQGAGQPAYEGPARRSQPWHGTDRQCRGTILAVLRESRGPVTARAIGAAWPADDSQRDRCLDSLVADGLVEPLSGRRFRLPGRSAGSRHPNEAR
ncbi:MAG TPA: A/G-specific adenine glycosylase [Dermatophilaceae bacterium]|nr:A/G-specific adenine glycosylase [Dermatophilaceae bacterium]